MLHGRDERSQATLRRTVRARGGHRRRRAGCDEAQSITQGASCSLSISFRAPLTSTSIPSTRSQRHRLSTFCRLAAHLARLSCSWSGVRAVRPLLHPDLARRHARLHLGARPQGALEPLPLPSSPRALSLLRLPAALPGEPPDCDARLADRRCADPPRRPQPQHRRCVVAVPALPSSRPLTDGHGPQASTSAPSRAHTSRRSRRCTSSRARATRRA